MPLRHRSPKQHDTDWREALALALGLALLLGLAGCGAAPAADPAPPADLAPPAEPATPAALPYAAGLRIAEVAVFQAVKVSVAVDGKRVDARRAPVVAGRDGLLRVYVKPDAGFVSRDVTAELQLRAAGTTLPLLRQTQRVTAASAEGDLGSTFDFSLAGASLPADVSYSVALLDPAGAPVVARDLDAPGRHPRGVADEPLGARAGAEQLRVTIVPVQYSDGAAQRLPDTSAAQLETVRKLMHALYPVASVELTVRAALPWTTPITANGDGLSALLQAVVAQRQRDGAPADVYYLALFAPAASEADFCKGAATCVAGLTTPALDERDASLRASVALGFSGAATALTAAHELGHAHGRRHSPCGGATGPDPAYPYTGGGIGVWGYSLPVKRLVDPAVAKDLMSYCSPAWVSDYTYGALFDRVAAVNASARSSARALAAVAPRRYRLADLGADGRGAAGEPLRLAEEPRGEAARVRYLAADGRALGEAAGAYYPYDHLPGGLLLCPEGPDGTASVQRLP